MDTSIDTASNAAPEGEPPGAIARLVQALFGRAEPLPPVEQPFHDSDFESDSGFFGRPLGEH